MLDLYSELDGEKSKVMCFECEVQSVVILVTAWLLEIVHVGRALIRDTNL